MISVSPRTSAIPSNQSLFNTKNLFGIADNQSNLNSEIKRTKNLEMFGFNTSSKSQDFNIYKNLISTLSNKFEEINHIPSVKPIPINIPFITGGIANEQDMESRPSTPIIIQTRPKNIIYQYNNIEDKFQPPDIDLFSEDIKLDPNYGASQQWLLNNRQGDQYDRLPEWIQDPIIADAEDYNLPGETTLNRGMVWGPLPKINPIPTTKLDEYNRLLEYAQTQIEEQSDI